MTIKLEFDTWEEIVNFAKNLLEKEEKHVKIVSGNKDTETPKAETVDSVTVEAPSVQETEEVQEYTLVDVRAKLAELQKSGKRDSVKALITSFGAERLSDIPEDKYSELMQKAGEL